MWSLSNIPSLCELGSVLFSIQRRPTGISPPGVANDDDDGGGRGAKENCFLVEKGQQLRRVSNNKFLSITAGLVNSGFPSRRTNLLDN